MSRLTQRFFTVVGSEQVSPGVGDDPQDVINKEIGEEYDVYIGIVGDKLGTPTPRAESGTIEEFEKAAVRVKSDATLRILFYLKKYPTETLSAEQKKDMETIRNLLTTRGVLYKEFAEPLELQTIVVSNLVRIIQSVDQQSIEVVSA